MTYLKGGDDAPILDTPSSDPLDQPATEASDDIDITAIVAAQVEAVDETHPHVDALEEPHPQLLRFALVEDEEEEDEEGSDPHSLKMRKKKLKKAQMKMQSGK
ncbi:hypothetical protein RIF29_33973 [Crotalaria pallida]|uniref:Uncharacterized protein n=1 Tax=Crotalaria pallida TaxID=3830 RepID=A0AAN9EB75_CROPI